MSNELKGVGHISPIVGWRMRSHWHDDYNEMIVLLRGQIRVDIRGQMITTRPGEVLHYPRGVAHEEEAVGKEPMEMIFISWRAGRAESADWPLKVADPHGRLEYLARWMWEVTGLSESRRKSLITSLFDSLIQTYRHLSEADEDDLVGRMRQFVHMRLSEPLRLDDLAEHAGFSRYHFLRLFRTRAGQTPMQFIRSMRVEAAKNLLLTTNLPLRTIASQVGLADEFNLSRVFLKETGKRPSMLRRYQ